MHIALSTPNSEVGEAGNNFDFRNVEEAGNNFDFRNIEEESFENDSSVSVNSYDPSHNASTLPATQKTNVS